MLPEPKIKNIESISLVGYSLEMSFNDNSTVEMWSTFMPRRKEVKNTAGTDLFNLQFYPKDFFTFFNPGAQFKKMAAVAVSAVEDIPEGMGELLLPGGKYAVINYKGSGEDFHLIITYILRDWLPRSGFKLDYSRPHFEILGEKYKRGHADSEEEIYIPIK